MDSGNSSKSNLFGATNDSNDNSINNDEHRMNDITELGLDYDEDTAGNGEDDQKQSDSSNDGDGSMTLNRSHSAFANYGLYGGYNRRSGLIPKLMRKYLNIITLNRDISSNVKLLTNLEKTFEIIANDLGIQTNENNVNSLLLQLNLFVHIHIDVECNNTDEIGKLLKLLKHKYFQCDYTSYHVIARKINVVSTPKSESIKPNVNSPRVPSKFKLSKPSRFTFNTNKLFGERSSDNKDKDKQPVKEQKERDIQHKVESETKTNNNNDLRIKSRISMKIDPDNAEEKDTEKGDGTNSNASTPKTANSDHNLTTDTNIKGSGGNISGIDNNSHNATSLVSPSILHRNTGVGVDFEIDDGNKSDGGTSSNTGSGINFKDAMNKMKLFGKSVQKLIKSNSDPTSSSNTTNNNNNSDDHESKTQESNSSIRGQSSIPYPHHTPNQILRFMKKATIHCDDIKWICDCKYAQCSRKYRTLYNDDNTNDKQ